MTSYVHLSVSFVKFNKPLLNISAGESSLSFKIWPMQGRNIKVACLRNYLCGLSTIHTAPLTPENTREIIDLAWPHRAKWRLIGTYLGIDTGELDAIDENNKKVEGCLIELITKWLRGTKPKPTHPAITAVLKSEHITSPAGTINQILLKFVIKPSKLHAHGY